MKKYVAPELHVDEFAPDTMIASSQAIRNGNAGNQTCYTREGDTAGVFQSDTGLIYCWGPTGYSDSNSMMGFGVIC